ncbi:hypothetical protein [Saccharibacillus sacchari]|uniref:Uncharacterized protein n=1 Tax=Saccharibacillus sacchari TaxID=456493 RepID=A0ACC6PCE8_9BACL
MRKIAKILCLIVFCSLTVNIFAKSADAAGDPLNNAYYLQEIGVFIDNNIVISAQKTYFAENNKVYVPIKTISRLKGVTLEGGKNLKVKSSKGTFTIDKSNSIAYKNTTYVTIEKFTSVTGYSGRYEPQLSSVFFWKDYESYQNTIKKINNAKQVYNEVRWYMGAKVYVYEQGQSGWVTDVSSWGTEVTEFTIQMVDGKVIEKIVYGHDPDTFCTYAEYESIKGAFKNKIVWADKHALPYSNPLYHTEKIKILNLDVDKGDAVIQARRAGGSVVSFRVPLGGFPGGVIATHFYVTDPKQMYPAWKSKAWELIAGQKITKGMTKDMVLMAWGNPDDTSSYSGVYISTDTWIYGDTYLNFTNGILDSWMDL